MPIMHIMQLPVASYSDMEEMESEVCRLLRCSHCKCAAMHTEAFMNFRAGLLQGINHGARVYLPEGLVLQANYAGNAGSCVDFSWMYAEV